MAFVIRQAESADRPGILRLFEKAFGGKADAADFAWKYDANPFRAVSVVALHDDRAVGFYGAFATRYRAKGEDRMGLSAVDVMTDPESRALGHRNLFHDLGEAYCRLNAEAGSPFYFGFPHERHRKVGERLIGYRSVEPAGLFVKRLPAAAPRAGDVRSRLRIEAAFGDDHSELAEAIHGRPGWRSDRSAATLAWRFSRPGVTYRTYQLASPSGSPIAYAVARLVNDRALLVDLQTIDDGDALPDLLDGVIDALKAEPLATLEVRASRGESLARRLRQELGFEEAPSDCHFEIRPLDPTFDTMTAGRSYEYRFTDHDIF